jgi:hypothetical protein
VFDAGAAFCSDRAVSVVCGLWFGLRVDTSLASPCCCPAD